MKTKGYAALSAKTELVPFEFDRRSLRLLKIKEMAVANLLPALAIAPLFALLAN